MGEEEFSLWMCIIYRGHPPDLREGGVWTPGQLYACDERHKSGYILSSSPSAAS